MQLAGFATVTSKTGHVYTPAVRTWCVCVWGGFVCVCVYVCVCVCVCGDSKRDGSERSQSRPDLSNPTTPIVSRDPSTPGSTNARAVEQVSPAIQI